MFSKSRMVRAGATAAAAATLVVGAGLPASATVGPDVSSWQHPHRGAISWTKVKATGATFVFIKATEGFGYTNPYFATDWAGSADAGLMHGAYHFARPTKRLRSAVVQARHFARVIGASRARGTLPPTLDLESSGGLSPRRLIAWTATWLRTVKSLTGRKPMIYSYPLFWARHMAGTRAFRSYPLWGACYCSSPTKFRGAWSHWTFWQYASTSRVRGVAGRTDMNRFNGSAAQLRRLARGGAPTAGDGEGRRARHASRSSAPARHHRHKLATKLTVHAPSRARRLAGATGIG